MFINKSLNDNRYQLFSIILHYCNNKSHCREVSYVMPNPCVSNRCGRFYRLKITSCQHSTHEQRWFTTVHFSNAWFLNICSFDSISFNVQWNIFPGGMPLHFTSTFLCLKTLLFDFSFPFSRLLRMPWHHSSNYYSNLECEVNSGFMRGLWVSGIGGILVTFVL